MRAMLPKDVLERFLVGPFQYEELRNRVSANVGEKLVGQDANGGAQPVDIGQIFSLKEDEDVNAVQQRRPHDRSNQKHKQERVRQRTKTLQLSDCQLVTISATPIVSTRQETTKQSAGKKKRLIC